MGTPESARHRIFAASYVTVTVVPYKGLEVQPVTWEIYI
jgi:hypothetical protein